MKHFIPPFLVEITAGKTPGEKSVWFVADIAHTTAQAQLKASKFPTSENLSVRISDNVPAVSSAAVKADADAKIAELLGRIDTLEKALAEEKQFRPLLVAEAGTDEITTLADAMRLAAGFRLARESFPAPVIAAAAVPEPVEILCKFEVGQTVKDTVTERAAVVTAVTPAGFDFVTLDDETKGKVPNSALSFWTGHKLKKTKVEK